MAKLRVQELNLSDVLDNASDLIQCIDNEGMLLYVNKAWTKTLKYSKKEVTGLNVMDIIHPDSRDHCMDLMQKIKDLKAVKNEKIGLLSKDGKKVYTVANITLRTDSEGLPIGTQALFRNVTDTHIAEKSARDSANLYKSLVESAKDLIYQSDYSGKIIFMNSLGEEFFGYKMNELVGSHYERFIREDYVNQVVAFYTDQFFQKVESTYLEFPIVMQDGTEKWVGQNVRTIFNTEDKNIIDGYIGVVRDITIRHQADTDLIAHKNYLEDHVSERTKELEEANAKLREEVVQRKQYEQRLEKSKREYEHLFENANDAIVVFRQKDEVVLEANKKACKLYRFPKKEFIGMSLEAISCDVSNGKRHIKKTLSTLDSYHFEIEQLTKKGEKILVEINASPIIYQNQNAILTINKDITKSRELSNQLEEERQKRVQALIDGQEIERKRISQELHDGVGQMLAALIRVLRKVKNADKLNKEQKSVLEESENLTNDIIQETRRIAKNLMPSALMDFGLESGLQTLVSVLEGSEVQIEYKSNGNLKRLDSNIEVGLYRIIQEAVSNSLKHAFADNIEIVAEKNEHLLIFQVIDDGIGFDTNNGSMKRGNGISNMRERARLLGAELNIISGLHRGSEIKITYNTNGKNKRSTRR